MSEPLLLLLTLTHAQFVSHASNLTSYAPRGRRPGPPCPASHYLSLSFSSSTSCSAFPLPFAPPPSSFTFPCARGLEPSPPFPAVRLRITGGELEPELEAAGTPTRTTAHSAYSSPALNAASGSARRPRPRRRVLVSFWVST
ncbi:hypothetical protein K438DRAFT_1972479 [Mycena galopus ATCC 62051]|nr:hypothetical protein K438DRAFT_1972479 [Mycena galopus ATCC 62051]